ncbi:MAG: hydrogenase maturation protease [Planctomycetota bacterium]
MIRRVIGVGNRLRGDDAAGLLAIDRLRELAPAGVLLETLSGAPLELARCWSGEDAVVILDAMRAGRPPGTIARFDALAGPLPADAFALSTHHLGVAQAVELARALDALPRRLIVLGVEGADFSAGAALSPDVAAALDELVQRALAELG